jgi:hypothetical protein
MHIAKLSVTELVFLEVRNVTRSWQGIICHILVILQYISSKHKVKDCFMSFTDLFIVYGMRKHCHTSKQNFVLYIFIVHENDSFSDYPLILLLPATHNIIILLLRYTDKFTELHQYQFHYHQFLIEWLDRRLLQTGSALRMAEKMIPMGKYQLGSLRSRWYNNISSES